MWSRSIFRLYKRRRRRKRRKKTMSMRTWWLMSCSAVARDPGSMQAVFHFSVCVSLHCSISIVYKALVALWSMYIYVYNIPGIDAHIRSITTCSLIYWHVHVYIYASHRMRWAASFDLSHPSISHTQQIKPLYRAPSSLKACCALHFYITVYLITYQYI